MAQSSVPLLQTALSFPLPPQSQLHSENSSFFGRKAVDGKCTSSRCAVSFSNARRSISTVKARATATVNKDLEFVNLKTYTFEELSSSELKKIVERPRIDFSSIFEIVKPIIEDVKNEGDAALKKYTEKFDKAILESVIEKVEDIPEIKLDPEIQKAFDIAYDNIHKFHLAQKDERSLVVETMPGVECRKITLPIESVGLYVPGGTAILPSTALMLTVPAKIAGCSTIVVATPPRKDGSICPEVLYCAKKAGATHILKAGGAQAVAAMAIGTESCPKVDKIFGPGNQYVTAAKMLLQNSEAMMSIDMPAGPSEVLVIIDESANPRHVAADLLSQAEHGVDSQVVLVTVGKVDVSSVLTEIESLCLQLPRAEIASKAIRNSFAIATDSIQQACEFSNLYAPEHLIINAKNAESFLPHVKHAGSVFLGPWTPESVGDYASGTNHVLPTYGYARMYSGVSLNTFTKHMTVQTLTSSGLELLGPHVATMANLEGLNAHELAVTLRLEDIRLNKAQ